MSARKPALRGALVAAACAAGLVVWIATAGGAPSAPARPRLPAAPAALPQIWGVEVDRATLNRLDGRLLRRLRAERVSLVAMPGTLSARETTRLARLAARA